MWKYRKSYWEDPDQISEMYHFSIHMHCFSENRKRFHSSNPKRLNGNAFTGKVWYFTSGNFIQSYMWKKKLGLVYIFYFQSLELTFVLCISLLFQICKPVVTQTPLHCHSSSSALCKESAAVPSQLSVGTRCLQSLHHTQQSWPKWQGEMGPVPEPPITTGRDQSRTGWKQSCLSMQGSHPCSFPQSSCLLHKQRAFLFRAPCTEKPFKTLGGRKQTGIS